MPRVRMGYNQATDVYTLRKRSMTRLLSWPNSYPFAQKAELQWSYGFIIGYAA